MRRALALVLLLVGCAPEPEPLVVFAAASMTEVAHQMAEVYERETGQDVLVSIGATSTLARQIEACGPADVLLAPSEEWVERLQTSGFLHTEQTIAEGALAVVVAESAAPWSHFQHMTQIDRLALADPAHVPAGRFAQAALEQAGLWEVVEPRVIPLPHVRAALAAVASGQADAAIVYASDLAVSDQVKEAVAWPDSLQPEIRFVCAEVGGWYMDGSVGFCTRPIELGPGMVAVEPFDPETHVVVIRPALIPPDPCQRSE